MQNQIETYAEKRHMRSRRIYPMPVTVFLGEDDTSCGFTCNECGVKIITHPPPGIGCCSSTIFTSCDNDNIHGKLSQCVINVRCCKNIKLKPRESTSNDFLRILCEKKARYNQDIVRLTKYLKSKDSIIRKEIILLF